MLLSEREIQKITEDVGNMYSANQPPAIFLSCHMCFTCHTASVPFPAIALQICYNYCIGQNLDYQYFGLQYAKEVSCPM